MPSKQEHIRAAVRNQATIDFLRREDEHLPWVVTVAFYKALHVVEAVFAADAQSPIRHTDDHKQRNSVLKTERRYAQLWRMYRHLWEASLVARYLRVDSTAPLYHDFVDYMPRAVVESRALGHFLRQVEASACNLLNDPHLLNSTS